MNCHKIAPSEALKNYIDYYWWIEDVVIGNEYQTEQVFADTSVEVIFHFGNSVLRKNNTGLLIEEPTKLLIGQNTKPYTIFSKGSISMLGIKFHSCASKHFFKVAISELKDSYFDLSLIWGSNADVLYNQLGDAQTLFDKIQILDKFFARVGFKRTKNDLLIENIVKDVLTNNGAVSIKSICAKQNVTTRHIEKLFKINIGLSPKVFSRIIQFRYAINNLYSNSSSLTILGLDSGYFDQSHFIKNFKEFAGFNPLQFKSNSFPMQKFLHE